jgi:hypothetical protein
MLQPENLQGGMRDYLPNLYDPHYEAVVHPQDKSIASMSYHQKMNQLSSYVDESRLM